MNRRQRRSCKRHEALQYLVEALARRSEVSSVVLVTEQGQILAADGVPTEIDALARIAGPATRGEPCPRFEEVTRGTDFLGRRIALRDDALYLAALGSRLRRMHDAVGGVSRILNHATQF